MKTIIIDNKHYIEGKIVMLPTKDLSPIVINKDDRLVLSLTDNCSPGFHKYIGNRFQHLYLVCDLPIEEGDWFTFGNTIQLANCIAKRNEFGILNWKDVIKEYKDCKKVIATTDYNLHQDNRKPLGIWINLPQFPQSFIKEFVERQGKDVDVLVEIDYKESYCNACVKDCIENGCKSINIKLNPDNTVNLIFK